MKRLLALVRKEFLQLRRDTITLRMIVMVPIIQTLIFGYAINYDVKHLKTVVLDEDKSYESRELVAKMTASEYFDVVKYVDSDSALRREIDSGYESVGLVIDHDYGKNRRRGVPAKALLVVNASDTVTASQAMGIAGGISNQLSFRTLAARAGWNEPGPPVDLRVRPWYNPDLRTATFIIPGLIAIILTFTLIQFTAMAIVRERERGTLEQLQVTPVTRVELILGKIAPFVLIGVFQLTLIIVLMLYLFQVPIAGSIVELYLVGFMFIAAVLGLGMLLSTLAATQMQAMQMSFFFILPFIFLSGYVFPIDGMPAIFRYLSYVIPAKYFIEVVRGIVLRGAGMRELWEPVAWLTFYTVVIIGLAVARFRKTAA
ncbi:MAG TPA: ABC transporter permease [Thermoanaerobaculia bacterium]|nr:ABC transporter permease [Thermoanaerobaculia bacterium]